MRVDSEVTLWSSAYWHVKGTFHTSHVFIHSSVRRLLFSFSVDESYCQNSVRVWGTLRHSAFTVASPPAMPAALNMKRRCTGEGKRLHTKEGRKTSASVCGGVRKVETREKKNFQMKWERAKKKNRRSRCETFDMSWKKRGVTLRQTGAQTFWNKHFTSQNQEQRSGAKVRDRDGSVICSRRREEWWKEERKKRTGQDKAGRKEEKKEWKS